VEKILPVAGILVGAYFLGGIPFAYIITRLLSRSDIRSLGDGNVGAKNTFHSVGPVAGVIVGVADVAKGMLAVVLARTLTGSEEVALASALSVVMGHDFSPFLRFQGGQGMAAMMGAFYLLFPVPTSAALLVCLAFLSVTRHWDGSWAAGFITLLAVMIVTGFDWIRVLFAVLMISTIGLRKALQMLAARRAKAALPITRRSNETRGGRK
jgi:glycerol-3-phosphate acyltransferase PlsY